MTSLKKKLSRRLPMRDTGRDVNKCCDGLRIAGEVEAGQLGEPEA